MEVNPVGRVHTGQVEVLLHALAQRRVGLGVGIRHQEEGRAGVEGETVLLNQERPSIRPVVFLQHSDIVPLLGQAGGGSDPTDAGPDDQCRFGAHICPPVTVISQFHLLYLFTRGWADNQLGQEQIRIEKGLSLIHI